MPTTNPHQSTPSAAGVSKRLPLRAPSAHHSSGPSDLVVSPQAESAPISGHSDLELPGSWPADHGNGMGMQETRRDKSATGSHIGRGSACMANGSGSASASASASTSAGWQSISTASTLTLTEREEPLPVVKELPLLTRTHTSPLTRAPVAGPSQEPSLLQCVAYWYIPQTRTEREEPSGRVQPSVEERLQSTLAATERAIRDAKRIATIYRLGYYIGMILGIALIPTFTLMLATLRTRWSVILAVVFAVVATLLGISIAFLAGCGEPEASRNHVKELDKFLVELRTFITVRGHDRDLPDVEGRDGVGQYQQRYRNLTGRPILQV